MGATFKARHGLLNGLGLETHDWVSRPGNNRCYLIDQFFATDEELTHIWDAIPDINDEWGCEFYEGFVATAAESRYTLMHSPDRKVSHIVKYRRHEQ